MKCLTAGIASSTCMQKTKDAEKRKSSTTAGPSAAAAPVARPPLRVPSPGMRYHGSNPHRRSGCCYCCCCCVLPAPRPPYAPVPPPTRYHAHYCECSERSCFEQGGELFLFVPFDCFAVRCQVKGALGPETNETEMKLCRRSKLAVAVTKRARKR